jgi:hypothetical protein
MALMNRPMYEHFAARHLAVKGPGALTSIEEGVMGTLPLDMSSDPTYWFIQGIRTYMVYQNINAGGAGTYAKAGLSIENASEEIITKILRIDISRDITNAHIYRCARTSFSSDPGKYGHGTDTRIAEAQPSQTVSISNNSAAFPGTQLGYFHQDFIPFMSTDQLPLIVSPGEAIYVATNTANAAFEVVFTWAEIPAYKAEL